ncbi:hypothetical protein LWI28_004014 [Acer negundo]|uniref:Protein PHLOEM PROTEIN 2-LIKE A10 n=1 Tax=Acer negundo TaxID=4023 RepID=A0AAD5IIL1_ACENE|nr:hypothetical protein LWI28_004014 [Acer negundo]
MDLQLLKKGLRFSHKSNRWLLLLAACGFSEAVSDSSQVISLVSKDLKGFLKSDSDQIPNSLKQISKITSSNEFSESVVNITKALTLGVLLGYRFESKTDGVVTTTNSSFIDTVMDKLFTKAGSGFVSVVVGSFARNLVMAFYSDGQFNGESENNSVPKWVNVVCSDKSRELIGDCIQLFVSTAVAVYLDKTMHINTIDDFFAGLTNPNHEARVRDVLVASCNGAIETLVKTSRQVLADSPYLVIDQGPDPNRNSFEFDGVGHSGWIRKASSIPSVPSNRKFVLDVTGKVTFEMVRSFLEVSLQKLSASLDRSVNAVHETVVQSGLEVVNYVGAKSSAVATTCLSLCLNILDGVWIMVPA